MSGTPVLLDVTDTPGRRKWESQGSATSTGGSEQPGCQLRFGGITQGAELCVLVTSTCSIAVDNGSFWKLPEMDLGAGATQKCSKARKEQLEEQAGDEINPSTKGWELLSH